MPPNDSLKTLKMKQNIGIQRNAMPSKKFAEDNGRKIEKTSLHRDALKELHFDKLIEADDDNIFSYKNAEKIEEEKNNMVNDSDIDQNFDNKAPAVSKKKDKNTATETETEKP